MKIAAFTVAAVMLLAMASCGLAGKYIPDTLVPPKQETTTPVTLPKSGMQTPDASFAYLSATKAVERSDVADLSEGDIRLAADFALNLLKNTDKINENEFISPLSIMLALGMAANGAWSDTRGEIEKMLGMSVERLNTFLNSYVLSLKNSSNAALVSANSAWINSGSGFSVREDYLENIGRYYDTKIISAPFGAAETLGEVNGWVSDNTDGMIEKILDELDPESVMLLINALTFDALWESQFTEGMVGTGVFNNSDGSRTDVIMMRSSEHKYISGKNCTGFIKDYAGGAYSYAAVLPDAGVSLEDFLSSLDGDGFLSLVNNTTRATVVTAMPKYRLDYSLNLIEILTSLGMKSAFSPAAADFSALGSVPGGNNLFISKMIHKTHIEIDESGTRAAAVTLIQITPTSAPSDIKYVTLDRPFLYAIIDNATGLPVFIGITESLK